MKVKLNTGVWNTQQYQLSIEDSSFTFSSGTEELRIPLAALTGVTITERGFCQDAFYLETEGQTYAGHFFLPEDAVTFIRAIKNTALYEMEINLIRGKEKALCRNE